MAATTPNYVVRPAKDLEEAKELWWPLMLELGWVRPSILLHSCKRKSLSEPVPRTAHETMQRPILTSPNVARIG
jgi:hypothetical protein